MNKHLRTILITFIFIAGGLVLYFRTPIYFLPDLAPIVQASPLVNTKPAGELIEGVILEQRVVLNSMESFFLSKMDYVCIQIFVATYRRKNSGELNITIETKEWEFSETVQFKEARDNQFLTKCEYVSIRKSKGSDPLLIRITSIEGKNGSSITAWLTDITKRGVVLINGESTHQSLVFSILEKKNPIINTWKKTVFILIYSITMTIFLVSLFRSE